MEWDLSDFKGVVITLMVAMLYYILRKIGSTIKKIDDTQTNKVAIEKNKEDIKAVKKDVDRIENKLMK